MFRVVDLFSCIGGHALGLHQAGEFRTVQFVEANEWRRLVISKHFPHVPIHDDVRTFRGVRGSAEIVIGGPPCQRTSVAAAIHGRRTGESLWSEMYRIADEIRPRWVVVEQPPGNREWEASVTADLERAGYGVARLVLSALGLGAPHIRRRVFLLAHPDVSRLEVAWAVGSQEAASFTRRTVDGNPWRAPFTGSLRMADGLSRGMDRRQRIEALGDSNPPAMMTVIGRAILRSETRSGDIQVE